MCASRNWAIGASSKNWAVQVDCTYTGSDVILFFEDKTSRGAIGPYASALSIRAGRGLLEFHVRPFEAKLYYFFGGGWLMIEHMMLP